MIPRTLKILAEIRGFVTPLYKEKDIMHDLSHIDRLILSCEKLSRDSDLLVDHELVIIAAYFHGVIEQHEAAIRDFLDENNYESVAIEKIIKIAYESLKRVMPETNEGKLLHDAHMLEGGKYFEIIKSLITGSVRGQSLNDTLFYFEDNILGKGQCYTAKGIELYKQTSEESRMIFKGLKKSKL